MHLIYELFLKKIYYLKNKTILKIIKQKIIIDELFEKKMFKETKLNKLSVSSRISIW